MGRDAVLAAVDAALASVAVPPLPQLAETPTATPEGATERAALTARFSAEARAVGTIVHVVPTRAAAGAIVAALFRDSGARRVVTWPSDLAQTITRAAAVELGNIDVHVLADGAAAEHRRASDADATATAAADVGITEAEALVAASGTLVLRAGECARMASLLPPTHVAVVDQRRLVPDLASGLRQVWRRRPVESCITLVTGPSRTADIEKKLVLGVHGPCALYVVLIEPED